MVTDLVCEVTFTHTLVLEQRICLESDLTIEKFVNVCHKKGRADALHIIFAVFLKKPYSKFIIFNGLSLLYAA